MRYSMIPTRPVSPETCRRMQAERSLQVVQRSLPCTGSSTLFTLCKRLGALAASSHSVLGSHTEASLGVGVLCPGTEGSPPCGNVKSMPPNFFLPLGYAASGQNQHSCLIE
eukprot:2285061-Amphidinium_carterae.1